jgi:hypothetical protein
MLMTLICNHLVACQDNKRDPEKCEAVFGQIARKPKNLEHDPMQKSQVML